MNSIMIVQSVLNAFVELRGEKWAKACAYLDTLNAEQLEALWQRVAVYRAHPGRDNALACIEYCETQLDAQR